MAGETRKCVCQSSVLIDCDGGRRSPLQASAPNGATQILHAGALKGTQGAHAPFSRHMETLRPRVLTRSGESSVQQIRAAVADPARDERAAPHFVSMRVRARRTRGNPAAGGALPCAATSHRSAGHLSALDAMRLTMPD